MGGCNVTAPPLLTPLYVHCNRCMRAHRVPASGSSVKRAWLEYHARTHDLDGEPCNLAIAPSPIAGARDVTTHELALARAWTDGIRVGRGLASSELERAADELRATANRWRGGP